MARGTALVVIAALALGLPRPALAQQYTVDSARSEALTAYLRRHRLPLVGAQVLKAANGGERLLLYGFVATNHGKRDARRRALAYLGSGDISVDDRIVVRPEIAKMKTPAALSREARAVREAGGEPGPTPAHGVSLDKVLNDISKYGVKSAPGQGDSP